MAALIYDSTSQAYKDTGGNKVYSSNDSAFVDAGGKVWNGSEWVDALGGSAVLTVGSIYTLNGTNTTAGQPIKAVCIQMDETNKTAVMQSYGFGHGTWPGDGTLNASSYGTSIGNFVINDIQLPKGTSSSSLTACGVSGQSSLIHTALLSAGSNRSFGGTIHSGGTFYYGESWLGTPYDSYYAWYVNLYGYQHDGSKDSANFVVSPCFTLSTEGVKLDGTTLSR